MSNEKNHLTIRSLLAMVSRPAPVMNERTGRLERRAPTAAQLRASAEELISSPDGSITVYSSGYAVCEVTAGTVVVDISKCADGYSQTYAFGSEGVTGSFSLDPETTDWHWIVMEVAEDQAERNVCHRKADRLGIGISPRGRIRQITAGLWNTPACRNRNQNGHRNRNQYWHRNKYRD